MEPQGCSGTPSSAKREPLSLTFSELTSFCSEELSQNDRERVLDVIQRGYGPGGLGVIVVSGVPGYACARKELLPLASVFASLDDSVKETCKDVESRFQIGWSHGIETLQNGQVDTFKGSYYANPVSNTPTSDEDTLKSYPVYARPNVWPTQELPELEQAFMKVGQLITRVGILLAKACDLFLETKRVPSRMEDILKGSMCSKGRLLHYFPTAGSSKSTNKWCGTHCDHGTLTGLCAAMYLDRQHNPVASPDSRAGLYVVDSAGEAVKIHLPEDSIGFQLGQAAQIMSDGLFRATPHYVKAPETDTLISRNTFACFLQPNWDEPMRTKVDPRDFGIHPAQWQKDCTFGEFAANTVEWFFAQTSGL